MSYTCSLLRSLNGDLGLAPPQHAVAVASPSTEAELGASDVTDTAFWLSRLTASAALSLGGPRSPPGLVPAPTLRTVPLPAAAGLSTPAVAAAAAATLAKSKRSSDVVVGIDVAGTDSAACTIVPVRIALDDSTAASDAVSAAAESVRAATEQSPVDLAQVRAWCGLSPSDPVCDVALCVGKASNASLAADLASTAAAIALAVDTSADGGSVMSIHDGRMLDDDQVASVALNAADLMSGKSIKEITETAIKRDTPTMTWPKITLSNETLAELAAVGGFVDAYPATPLQAGMVVATMQDARAYVNQVPLRATRTVSLESLRAALRAVVQHHAILRTSFVSTVAGGIVQVVRASADAAECVAVAAPLAQHLAADMARGFSLADASWIRAVLVCDPAGSAQHVVVTIHHALYDGWSLPMIMRDLAAIECVEASSGK
ncbi:hypothetical protein HK105_207208 [Polyrhizophydium stewartii]|uniref:Condensation domain-containing protein n=1 Tax=Polyrhizophydium stewartii TaxID=2732419 RepID=A0ABR4N1F9_9FUNG